MAVCNLFTDGLKSPGGDRGEDTTDGGAGWEPEAQGSTQADGHWTQGYNNSIMIIVIVDQVTFSWTRLISDIILATGLQIPLIMQVLFRSWFATR